MRQLPIGWTDARLGEVATYWNGRAFKESEWRRAGLPIIRIQNLNNPAAAFNYADGVYESRYKAQSGDLLVAWAASLGAHIWEGGGAWVNQHIFRVEPNPSVIDKQYLYYAVTHTLAELIDKTHGSGIVHVTKKTFERHTIPLPPLAEQKRIAIKLDAVRSQVEACRERLDRVPQILKKFREAVLEAAVSGRLTQEWRADANLPRWTEAPLGSLCRRVSVGHVGITSKHYTSREKGVPFVRSQNVRPGHFDGTGLVYITKEFHSSLKKSQLHTGDLMVVRVGANRGDACIVPPDLGELNCANIVFAQPRDIDSEFLGIYFRSPRCQSDMLGKSVGGAQGVINTRVVENISVPLPARIEQREITLRVNGLFAGTDILARRYREAVGIVEKLTPSVLEKAFRGRLVPQDPNDEPASVLLERTKAEQSEGTSEQNESGASLEKGRAVRRGTP